MPYRAGAGLSPTKLDAEWRMLTSDKAGEEGSGVKLVRRSTGVDELVAPGGFVGVIMGVAEVETVL